MATMIPENVQVFKTDGERAFYHFLKAVAKPDDQYVVWYSPDLNNQEPDFVLYNKDAGIVVLEVKDWALDQIVEADPHSFKLRMGSKLETRTSPIQQAGGYMYDLMDVLKTDVSLILGILKFLVGPNYVIVFMRL